MARTPLRAAPCHECEIAASLYGEKIGRDCGAGAHPITVRSTQRPRSRGAAISRTGNLDAPGIDNAPGFQDNRLGSRVLQRFALLSAVLVLFGSGAADYGRAGPRGLRGRIVPRARACCMTGKKDGSRAHRRARLPRQVHGGGLSDSIPPTSRPSRSYTSVTPLQRRVSRSLGTVKQYFEWTQRALHQARRGGKASAARRRYRKAGKTVSALGRRKPACGAAGPLGGGRRDIDQPSSTPHTLTTNSSPSCTALAQPHASKCRVQGGAGHPESQASRSNSSHEQPGVGALRRASSVDFLADATRRPRTDTARPAGCQRPRPAPSPQCGAPQHRRDTGSTQLGVGERLDHSSRAAPRSSPQAVPLRPDTRGRRPMRCGSCGRLRRLRIAIPMSRVRHRPLPGGLCRSSSHPPKSRARRSDSPGAPSQSLFPGQSSSPY